MAVDFRPLQKRYEKLIQDIIEGLDGLFSDLLEEKEKAMKLRNAMIKNINTKGREKIAIRHAKMETMARDAKLFPIEKAKLDQISILRNEFEKLISEEIDIERRKATAIENDPNRKSNEGI